MPSSPYSASKASADHLINSYIRTFKMPIIISKCCNNYGPNQFPEKIIPKIISISGPKIEMFRNKNRLFDLNFFGLGNFEIGQESYKSAFVFDRFLY